MSCGDYRAAELVLAEDQLSAKADFPALFEIDRYDDFLARRRDLLARKANDILSALYEGKDLGELLAAPSQARNAYAEEHDEDSFSGLSNWLSERGYEHGSANFGVSGLARTEIVDLAWPDGLQVGLGDPIALMVDSTAEARSFVLKQGYRVFETPEDLMSYVQGPEGEE